MDWDIVNGISGVVSALGTVLSLGYMLSPRQKVELSTPNRIISLDKFMHFLLASSGWVLLCLSYLWFFEPFGRFPLDYEYKQFFGVLLSFPALIIFFTGLKYLQNNQN